MSPILEAVEPQLHPRGDTAIRKGFAGIRAILDGSTIAPEPQLLKAGRMIAEFDSLEDARLFADLKLSYGELVTVTSGVNHVYAVRTAHVLEAA